MAYNYSKLLGRIVEKFGSQGRFSTAIGMSERTLSLKLNNHRPFTQPEIASVIKLLDIEESEIPVYFFTLQVQCS